MKIGLDQLLALRDQYGSLFVFAGRGRWFWPRGVNAYPFPDGVLLIREDDDERRWPGAFVTEVEPEHYAVHAGLPADRAVAFWEQWMFHLAGIVEYAPVPIALLEWSFPPECL